MPERWPDMSPKHAPHATPHSTLGTATSITPNAVPATAPKHSLASQPHPLAGRLAVPSFVLPGTVADNVRFLAGRVDEVALCFFESRGCLAYGPLDLPTNLLQEIAPHSMRFHLHLPDDLPWPEAAPKPTASKGSKGSKANSAGGASACAGQAVDTALAVFAKAAYLKPWAAVLHAPHGSPALQRPLLMDFAKRWHAAVNVPLLLENIDRCDIVALGPNFTQDAGFGVCLDVGHLLGYGQQALDASRLPEEAVLIHWSAPGRKDEHLPLTALTAQQGLAVLNIMARLPKTAVHVAEVFHWAGAAASLAVLAELATSAATATTVLI